MTRDTLINALDKLGVSRSSYAFDNELPDVDLLGQIGGRWSLYFVERGKLDIVQQFSSEAALYEFYFEDAAKKQVQRIKSESLSQTDIFNLLEQAQNIPKKNTENWRDQLIPWHFADSEFDETIQWAHRRVEHTQKMLELYLNREKLAQDTDRLRSLSKNALEAAIVGFLAETHSQNVYQDLNLSAYAGTQLCGTFIHVPEGEKYQINWLMNGPLEAVRTPVDAQALPSYFQQAMYCAFICRNIKILDQLAQLPLEPLENATNSPTPAHLHLMLQAFQQFWLGHTAIALQLSNQAIESVQNLIGAQQTLTWREAFYRDVTIPNAQLFQLAIAEKTTSTEFNAKLTEALLAFSQCMKTHENLFDDWNYYFHLGALAWASLAQDRGLEIDVISDYVPSFLYQGKFASQKVNQ